MYHQAIAGGVRHRRGLSLADWRVALAIIAAVAVATRIVSWWNPVAHVDDQFYLLVGEDLLRGRWPYIDVWDRKPPGLFLIYAGIAAIGGGSVVVLNLIATAFATATALVIRQIALRYASAASALMAALTYLFVIPLYGGQNAQAPVFYNLLIAGAVLVLLRSFEQAARRQAIGSAMAAMLLCGLAITIKPPSVAEGIFVGLAFLWLFRRLGIGWPATALWAAAMAATALLPTTLGFLAYAIAGPEAAAAYVYANFVSIFERESFRPMARIAGFALLLLYLFPLIIMAALGVRQRLLAARAAPATILLAGWLASAVMGYLTVPAFFDHYALPLIVPLSVAAAIFYDRGSWRLFLGYVAFCLIEGAMTDWPGNRAEAAKYEEVRALVDRARQGGCVYVADGPSRLYVDFPDCRPTRFLFPDHLMLRTEANAIGTSTILELRRVLDTRPQVIVARKVRAGRRLPHIQRELYDRLARDYRLLDVVPTGYNQSLDGIELWQRRDLAEPRG